MQILVKSTSAGKLSEWGLLEFQGDLTTRENQPMHDQFIGDLNFTKEGVPFFIIGHHILYGQEIKLPRPMAVLVKKTDAEQKEFLVRAVVREKIVFKSRPKPIVSSDLLNNMVIES